MRISPKHSVLILQHGSGFFHPAIKQGLKRSLVPASLFALSVAGQIDPQIKGITGGISKGLQIGNMVGLL